MSKKGFVGFMICAGFCGILGGYLGVRYLTLDSIWVENIIIKDKEGNKRMFHTAEEGMPALIMIDKEGDLRMGLLITESQDNGIFLTEKEGEIQLALYSSATDNNYGLAYYEGDPDTQRMFLSLQPGKGYGLNILDRKGNLRTFYGFSDMGEFKLAFWDEDGNEIWKVPPNENVKE